MSRLPIRLRLTIAFAGSMALVLAAAAFFVYDRQASSLDSAVDQGLQARAADVTALIEQADSGLRDASAASALDGRGEGFAQILDSSGRVFDGTPGLGSNPLLAPAELPQAPRGTVLLDRRLPEAERVRLLAIPVQAQGEELTVVVGTSLEVRDEALAGLRHELFLGGPLALALAALIGYLVAGAAFRPVERMRAHAAVISANRIAERLPAVRTNDEVGRLGATLNDMLARLEAGMERERGFVADASHELRAPLTLLQTEIDLALDGQRTQAQLEDALRSAGEETARLSRLAEDLLLLARIDRGALPMRVEATKLDDVVSSLTRRFQQRLAGMGRTIDAEGGGLVVHADRARVEQALTNLLENALRHGRGAVRLRATGRDGWATVQVTDDGPGFPEPLLDLAFERFSQGDESRGSGGTGLGLAIVAAIAEAHGGSARASNREPSGADVSFSVPLYPEHAETRSSDPAVTGAAPM